MNIVKICWIIIVGLAVMGMVATSANAQTAQEIANSVIDELNNVTDYTATVDVDYDDESIADSSDGSIQWKNNSGTWMTKMVDGTPYSGTYISDGSIWNFMDTEVHVMSKEDGDAAIHFYNASNMFNMETILSTETWSKDTNTQTINSISCYRLYTSKSNYNYEVWIDVATMSKVIRIKTTDGSDDLQWQLDYSDYSNIESTAQLPATIVTKFYDYNNSSTPILTATYTFGDIDINEGLSDSIFVCSFDLSEE